MLKDIKAIIFDLDGSLVDSMWMWKSIDIEFLGERNILLPPNLQKEIEGMSFSETAVYFKETFCLSESLDEIKNIWNQMAFEKYTKEVTLKKGALPLLEYCKKKGILLGIATSNSRYLAESNLKALRIFDYFTCIVTACDVQKGKPAPDVYLEAAKQMNVYPTQCLVFEDIVMGIMAGKNAGMKVCAVEDEYSMYQKEDKIKYADYYVKDFDEINYE